MKKLLLLFVYCGCICTFLFAQKENENKTADTLKKVLELPMPKKAGSVNAGFNGASIVWHPKQKKYYAAMAGNLNFPLAVFDEKGKKISSDSLICNYDVRGLWYDAVTGKINGNAYGDDGWFYYELNENGIPETNDFIIQGPNQPAEECTGVYDEGRKKVLFLYNGNIYTYDATTAEASATTQPLHWGRNKSEGPAEDETDYEIKPGYNGTLVFTGNAGAELGLLNAAEKRIELYNIKDGFMVKFFFLPEKAAISEMLNFAYANGMYWLFNKETRTWTGYK